MSDEWREIVAREIAGIPFSELVKAARRISEGYRGFRSGEAPLLQSDADRAAYLAVRMPATFAAISAALRRLSECARDLQPATLLDLGAGPGTASLAALGAFPSLVNVTLVERDVRLGDMARRLLPGAHVMTADLNSVELPAADLVVCAYALNELTAQQQEDIVHRAMDSAQQAVVVVEPGSVAGFGNVLRARQSVIDSRQFEIAAPCPGHMPCPLAVKNDWCHFAARTERSSLHRRLKSGELPYEDEKFSYVAAARRGVERASARIVGRPEKLSGHVKLTLCTRVGLELATLTKKDRENYKSARKSEWGDAWDGGLSAETG